MSLRSRLARRLFPGWLSPKEVEPRSLSQAVACGIVDFWRKDLVDAACPSCGSRKLTAVILKDEVSLGVGVGFRCECGAHAYVFSGAETEGARMSSVEQTEDR